MQKLRMCKQTCVQAGFITNVKVQKYSIKWKKEKVSGASGEASGIISAGDSVFTTQSDAVYKNK